jgi:hypothetical protein
MTFLVTETTDIAVVEEKQRLIVQIVHIVLIGEPWAGIG